MTLLSNIPNSNNVDNSLLLLALTDKMKGNITMKELMDTIYEWSYHYAFKNGYFVRIKEIPKPESVVQLDKLSVSELKFVSQDKFDFAKSAKLEWLDENGKIILENKGNYNWLCKMRDHYLIKGDKDKALDIRDRMVSFEKEKE